LPKNLRYEAALAMHGGAAKHIAFFKNRDTVFLSNIVPFLKPMFFAMGDIIFTEGEYSPEFYFINKGRINYVFGEQHLCYKSYSQGAYFGEMEVILKIPRKYSVQAAIDTDLLSADKSLLITIESDFPIVYDEFLHIAETRDKINEKARDDIEELMAKDKRTESKKMSVWPGVVNAARYINAGNRPQEGDENFISDE
jgi:signal-transduction protein with cAMP-binding, CBS, and nucleotidyltransferase domain